ncbi:uncharacterized protein PpBr36_10423 [Pyricularia pennisetigena]|uniref:uncharacterized protein n=1 Tax=Pyricularia pennisetigena TaxID=1578925 RepID=UPI001154426B|nr:uncharacterized protein PpBr36_10423 [Pyricularia pennisetigena]TLS21495.1 hypothetical protein PpBr36_10423 [Pyricularia pennisetigena]
MSPGLAMLTLASGCSRVCPVIALFPRSKLWVLGNAVGTGYQGSMVVILFRCICNSFVHSRLSSGKKASPIAWKARQESINTDGIPAGKDIYPWCPDTWVNDGEATAELSLPATDGGQDSGLRLGWLRAVLDWHTFLS